MMAVCEELTNGRLAWPREVADVYGIQLCLGEAQA
jgi:hypothetical protein